MGGRVFFVSNLSLSTMVLSAVVGCHVTDVGLWKRLTCKVE